MRILQTVLESNEWHEFWEALQLPLYTFADLELPMDLPDSALWNLCQEQQMVLITANRNNDGPDSLEATIRKANRAESLPVFTIANAKQVYHSKEYAEKIVVKLLDYLGNIDNYRGTGRLYLP